MEADFLGLKPDGRPSETLILAQTNVDVLALNAMARSALKADSGLENEARFVTARGERMFAPGDRVLFLENDRQLGVKNAARARPGCRPGTPARRGGRDGQLTGTDARADRGARGALTQPSITATLRRSTRARARPWIVSMSWRRRWIATSPTWR